MGRGEDGMVATLARRVRKRVPAFLMHGLLAKQGGSIELVPLAELLSHRVIPLLRFSFSFPLYQGYMLIPL